MSPEDLKDPLVTALADRYDIRRELGQGGMATVYLANDLRHDRPVAVKVISPHLAPVESKRFLAEIRTVANLTHPHILPLHDSGESEGRLYYVMPYVDGDTLADQIRARGKMSVDETLGILREIGGALAHAHRRGIVHRDVKPSNIFLTEGHAFLADFGVAKVKELGDDARLTRTGAAMGTPLYMSPEQAQAGDLDGRSDMYSLACVAFEMLTGAPPFTGATVAAILASHVLTEAPSVTDTRPDIPLHVAQAITRALAKAPEDRFASMEEFLGALAGDSVAGPRAGPRTTVAPKRGLLVGGGLALLVGAAVAVIVWGGGAESTPGGAGSSLVERRVVVAPLENETGDPSLDAYGRLGAEWITEGLHRTGVVDVVPSLTATQAVNFVRGLQERSDTIVNLIDAVAAETGAEIVVSGTYYLFGDTIQYQLELTNAASGTSLDAIEPVRGARFDPSAAIGQLRDRVMGSLSLNLDDRIRTEGLAAVEPPSFESYQAFDEGMEAYLDGEWRTAAASLLRAHDLDTAFVLPLLYAGLSLSNVREMATVDSLGVYMNQRRARLSEYHRHWLDYMDARTHGRNEDARVAIREAARLAPESKAVYNYAYAAQLTHRPREAVTALETLDPERGPMRGWLPYWQMLTDNLHRLGDHEAELAAARRSRELHPSRGWPIRMEGEALAALGEIDEIDALVSEIPSVDPRDITFGGILDGIGSELRSHGHLDESNALFERSVSWFEQLPDSLRALRLNVEVQATALGMLGRTEEAAVLIDSLRERYPDDLTLVGWEGILAARAGRVDVAEAARAALSDAERADPYSRGFYSLQLARIAGALGDPEEATALLRSAVDQGMRPLRHAGLYLEDMLEYPPFVELLTPVDG